MEVDPPPASFRLPQEIHDAILDHLHADFLTLKVCSLVCRAWLPTTRLHLFHSIRLADMSQFCYFSHLL
ncbi:uncharacterized protein LAESUDRAFT_652307, partial [Laetiporus sulphureus 93-53]